jgi:endo-1,4-beta-xylanase
MKDRTLTSIMGLLAILAGTTCSPANADVPALKDVFAKDFLIGGALNDRLVSGKDPNAAALAERHFNSITPENAMKWVLIHPEPNRYDFAAADRLVEFGQKNKQFIVGHCLVWHTQVPASTFRDIDGNSLTREALLARMKDHIQTVVGRYKGKVQGWDVVNEAFYDSGTLRQTQWLKIIGEDYIEKAFQYAHEADPNAELYYNDYNLDTMKAKCDAAAVLVKGLQSKGIRIDGVGIQLHGGLTYPRKESLDYALTTLAATGVKVMVTELDIRTQTRGYRGADVSQVNRQTTNDPNAAATETQMKLAEKYAEIFSVLLKHKKAVSRVTFWGVYDATSWIGGSPLLFDRKCQPKLAYFAVVKTAQDNK